MDFGAILVIVIVVLWFVLCGYIGHRIHEARRKERKIRDVAYREALRREKELDREQQQEKEQQRKQS